MEIRTFELLFNVSGAVLAFDAPGLAPVAVAVTPGGGPAWIVSGDDEAFPLAGGLSAEEVVVVSEAPRLVAAVGGAPGTDPVAFDLAVREVAGRA